MNAKSFMVVVPATAGQAFNYLSDIDNPPEWATEFCRALRHTEDGTIVTTPMGERHLRVDADPDTGVIDMFTARDGEREGRLPTRVLPWDDTHCAYVAGFFRPAEMSEATFAAQCASLEREMQGLKRLFS